MDIKDCNKLLTVGCKDSFAYPGQKTYGFCYVDGCPVSPEKTEELLERIAFIRVTHYGQ
jgi:hypothetical protein